MLTRLLQVQDAAGVGVFDDDLEEAHIEWDDRMRAIWGLHPDQPVTRAFFMSSILPEDRQKVAAAFWAACNPAGNLRFASEYRIRRQDNGEVRHVAVTGIVTLRDGKPRRLVGSARDVSASRLAERAKTDALALAEGLLATAPTLIYVYDLVERTNIYLSAQGTRMIGLTQADIDKLGSSVISRLMHPDDLARIEHHHEAIRSGAIEPPYEIEFRMRHRDGHYLWFASKEVVHHRDEQGRPRQILGASLDVTALKVAEQSARSSSHLLQSVINAVPSVIFVKDRLGRYLLANEETVRVIGRPIDQIIGRTDEDWTSPDQLAGIHAIDRHIFQHGVMTEQEEEFHHDSVGPRTFLTRKTPLLDDMKQVTGLIGAAIEVTDRVRAVSNLAENEARLRRVLDQLFAFVGVTTPDGVLLWANRAPLQLAGVTGTEVFGRSFWETHWWSYSAEAQGRVQEAMARAAQGETVRFDIPALFADLTPKTIDFQVAPLLDRNGQVENLIPSAILIEDRVQAERARELLIGELHHRIKNLYAIASGMVQQSARTGGDLETLVKSVCGRLSAMAKAHDLIRPSGNGQHNPILLKDLLEQILPQHAHSASQIVLNGPAAVLASEAVTPMALVFHELATNAFKYGALSSPCGRVSISWELTADRLMVRWQEANAPNVASEVARPGFGSMLIKASIEQQLHGRVQREFFNGDCSVILELPASAAYSAS